ncbi:SMP-30/gluconolactonase/LRE family protein [Gordonia hydrophobica]|uniref:SMP-30/gluconolactonase/LRE family protein n=1 Tax=Gordonia hydrophobica TaxID=40516 RepID=A0ABZ2U127_9ACTN|nr:SMP-30/gluconolactonase/LRE family protein [Gordonia hydrophobica]MBM7368459.1 sugar lactone lactonase YvrE [Gordonia hydrophobica]
MTSFRRIALPGAAPEDVLCLDDGRVITGLNDGRLLVVDPATDEVTVLADTAGHLLGLEIGGDGALYLCDHDRGLLKLEQGGSRAVVLADTVEGRPLRFASNVARTADGTLYFSSSSQNFTIDRWRSDLIEHSGTGRLMRLAPGSDVEVLRDDLQFANGLVLGPDDAYVLVAETGASRISRYWLTGDAAGTSDVFLDGLGGYPDNMSIGSDGLLWVALASPRNSVLEGIFRLPLRARKVLARAPQSIGPAPEEVVWVQAYRFDGTLVHDIRIDDLDYGFVTAVAERDGTLYLGTILGNALGVLDIPA